MFSRRTVLAGTMSLAVLGIPTRYAKAESEIPTGQRPNINSHCSGAFITPEHFTSRIFDRFHYELFSDGTSKLLNDLSTFKQSGALRTDHRINQQKTGAYYVSNQGSPRKIARSQV